MLIKFIITLFTFSFSALLFILFKFVLGPVRNICILDLLVITILGVGKKLWSKDLSKNYASAKLNTFCDSKLVNIILLVIYFTTFYY
jgi:hypothetical protein